MIVPLLSYKYQQVYLALPTSFFSVNLHKGTLRNGVYLCEASQKTSHVEFELLTSLAELPFPSAKTLQFYEEVMKFEEKLVEFNWKLCFGEEKKVENDGKACDMVLGLK